jgi:N-acetyl-anhydromuramyl-L-alanine amidase AmpD
MKIELPCVRQSPTPNYSATPIRHDLVIVHRTEGGYAGAVAWLSDPRARASAHLVMKADGSEVTQLVPLQFKAWAQCAFNSAGI